MRFRSVIAPALIIALMFATSAGATLYKWSQTAATNATADSTINWAEGMPPSAVNDSARAMMAAVSKWRDDESGSLVTAGTSTAYTLTTNQNFTSGNGGSLTVLDGKALAFRMSATSGAAPTLNVDSLGAKALNQSTGVAVATGALISGAVYKAVYVNATSEFIVQGLAGTVPSGTTMLSTSSGCPAGWTIQTSITDDRTLRWRTTAGGGTGGSVAWATVFGRTATDSAAADLAAHTHTFSATSGGVLANHAHTIPAGTTAVGAVSGFAMSASNNVGTIATSNDLTDHTHSVSGTTGSTGAGGGHAHNIDLRSVYVEVIGCTKN